mmetsp:Transcript_98134/g.246036  ORF Transcript_98134/g.246036 Transcript_98134/m.246036 type:complete len:222 (-) Transcript_98134:303-968(-)
MFLHLWIQSGFFEQLGLSDSQVLQSAIVVEQIRFQASLGISTIIKEVVHSYAFTLRFGGMYGGHTHNRGQIRSFPTVHQVQELVVRADDVHVANEEPVAVVHTVTRELRDLFLHEGDGVHHTLRADRIDFARGQQAARTEVKSVFDAGRPNDGVASILATVDTCYHFYRRMHGNGIHGFALALIPKETTCHHQAMCALDERIQDGFLRGLGKLSCWLVAQL